MKLLLDQGLPRSAADLLNAAGFDSVHVADALAHDALDSEILMLARQHGRAIFSLDADFHTELALSGAHPPNDSEAPHRGFEGGRAGETDRTHLLNLH